MEENLNSALRESLDKFSPDFMAERKQPKRPEYSRLERITLAE